MVDVKYNQSRVRAIALINKLVERGEFTKNFIIIKVMEMTGFGDQFIGKYIDRMIEEGTVIETKDGILGFGNRVKE